MTTKNKWLVSIGSLLAVIGSLFFLKKKQNEVHEKPPKNAPQLNIENPGTQDDFTTSATESEVG